MKKLLSLFLSLHVLFTLCSQTCLPKGIVFPDPRKINENYRFGTEIVGVDGLCAVGAPTADNHGVVYLFEKQGGAWNHIALLKSSQPIEGEQFGLHLAMDSSTVVVGFASGLLAKSVFVYQKSSTGWTDMTETAVLFASDSLAGDGFGHSLAIQGNHIFVGSPKSRVGAHKSGAVYIFEKTGNNWVSSAEIRKVTNPNAYIDDEFAYSIAVQGNHLLVGTPREWTSGLKGKAYLFENQGSWTQGVLPFVELVASNGAYGDRFGHSVALLGNDILVGAPAFDGSAQNSGLVYQFSEGSGWISSTETTILVPPTASGVNARRFGDEVHIFPNGVCIGVPNENNTLGGIYVYTKTGNQWNTSPGLQVVNVQGQVNDFFGQGVAVIQDEILVGIPGVDMDLTNEGKMSIIRRNGNEWNNNYTQFDLLPPANISFSEERFGTSVDMEGDIMVVGAPRTDLKGVAYVKEFDGVNWNTIAQLRASNGYDDQWFGRIVKIDGDWIGVVSGVEAWDTSAIYLFKKPATGWADSYETCVLSFVAGSNQNDKISDFDMDNGTLVASCSRRKRAYLFEKGPGDWTSSHTAIAGLQEPFSSQNGFGYAVKIENDVVVVSDPFRMINASAEKGALLVYEKPSMGWMDMVSTAILRYGDLSQSFRLGMSVDIEDDLIVAGCPFFKSPQFNSMAGAGVVFKRTGTNWTNSTEVATLNYKDIPNAFYLGASVSIEAEKVYMGALWASTTNSSHTEGAFMVFDKDFRSYWFNSFERDIIYGDPAGEPEVFGNNILVQGTRIVLGSQLKDSVGHNSGAVHVYESCYDGSHDSISVCGSYQWVDGITYTESPDTTLEFVLSTAQGCDSIVYLDLSINSLTAGIGDSSAWLIASPQFKQYAWYDCTNDSMLTAFFSANSYMPTLNGSYAVIVKDGNCVDTSECIEYKEAGLSALYKDVQPFQVSPNPNTGTFRLDGLAPAHLQMFTLDGKEIEVDLSGSDVRMIEPKDGIYLLVVHGDDGITRTGKVVVKNK